jgi:hypothetical protein
MGYTFDAYGVPYEFKFQNTVPTNEQILFKWSDFLQKAI